MYSSERTWALPYRHASLQNLLRLAKWLNLDVESGRGHISKAIRQKVKEQQVADENQVDDVEVSIERWDDGSDGPGWYLWETEHPEEGSIFCGPVRPIAGALKAICAHVERRRQARK